MYNYNYTYVCGQILNTLGINYYIIVLIGFLSFHHLIIFLFQLVLLVALLVEYLHLFIFWNIHFLYIYIFLRTFYVLRFVICGSLYAKGIKINMYIK